MAEYTLSFTKVAYPSTQAEKDHALAVYAKFLRGCIIPNTAEWNDSQHALTVQIDDSKITLLQVNAIDSINMQPERYPCFHKLEHRDTR